MTKKPKNQKEKKQEGQEIIKKLKKKLNQSVKLKLHSKHEGELEHQILFGGIYGVGGQPWYILGTRLGILEKRLYRNNNPLIYRDDDSGHSIYRDRLTIIRLDEVDIESWFPSYCSDKDGILEEKISTMFEKKVRDIFEKRIGDIVGEGKVGEALKEMKAVVREGSWSLDIRITEGLGYLSIYQDEWDLDYCPQGIIDDPRFINKVLTYLERIV